MEWIKTARIHDLKKWRKEICEEFEKWPMFYTSRWFIDQMSQIDALLEKLEFPSPPQTNNP